MLVTELGLAADVGRHFDALGVRWLVGGSVAYISQHAAALGLTDVVARLFDGAGRSSK